MTLITPCMAGSNPGRELRAREEDSVDGQLALADVLMGFAVGLFVHALPGSWWPRWLQKLAGKKDSH